MKKKNMKMKNMKTKKKINFLLQGFIILIIFFATAYCENGSSNNSTITKFYTTTDQKNLINTALDTWGIGLKNNLNKDSRSIGNNTNEANPKNWIVFISPNGCSQTLGVDQNNCAQVEKISGNGVTAGVCFTRYYTGSKNKTDSSFGQIADSTAIINTKVLSNLSDNLKLNVLVHEIGHCLGLQHWTGVDAHVEVPISAMEPDPPNAGCLNSSSCNLNLRSNTNTNRHIMHPFVSGSPTPKQVELDAINAVYKVCQNSKSNCSTPQQDSDNNRNFSRCAVSGQSSNLSYDIYSKIIPCYYGVPSSTDNPSVYLDNFRIYQAVFPDFYFPTYNSNALTFEEVEETQKGELLKGPTIEVMNKIILNNDGTFSEINKTILQD